MRIVSAARRWLANTSFRDPDVLLQMIDPRANASKFYAMQVVQQGSSWIVDIEYGRIGKSPRVTTLGPYYSEREAERAMAEQRSAKVRKGYQDVTSKGLSEGLDTLPDQGRQKNQALMSLAAKVPTSWGMFSSAGNRVITNYAKALMGDLHKAQGIEKKQESAFLKYFTKYHKLAWQSRTHGEAGDTDVREQVWGWAESVARELGFDTYILDKLWDRSQ